MQRHRVRRILLVSSLYDSFILAEDGQLSETILSQFVELNLSITPDLQRVSSGAEALRVVRHEGSFDLIITTLHVGDMHAVDLAKKVREAGLNIPVILLAYDNRELTDFKATHDLGLLERTFLWQGDVRILLAMVKYIEDCWNVEFDTGVAGVPAIIVVEDNVRYYSAFLPVIYTELVKHTQGLISEGLNLYQKMIRMRARPKILLCETYEEALHYFSTYEEHILGIISDIEFPRGGHPEPKAGVRLAKRVKEVRFDIPIMLQSSFPENEALAREAGAVFGLKNSPLLLHELRKFMVAHFGFGDFHFKMPNDKKIDRATDLKSLVKKLRTVPPESIAFHASRNHFSNWLKARGEYTLANMLRPRRVEDYATLEDLRQDLVRSIEEYRRERDHVIVADFDRERYDLTTRTARIGGGSLGGKARGLAFVNRLLRDSRIGSKFPDQRIFVPESVVLGTDIFDQFLEENDLEDFALTSESDDETVRRFLEAKFPAKPLRDLEAMLNQVRYPLAVRSSGLLEDSPNQPFAGVYQTYMLPNNDLDTKVRLRQLLAAVKRVYASTFSIQAKQFLDTTPFRLEEEKMAVILQRIVGAKHGRRFYPHFAGVARSYNFYPTPPLEAEDGIVAVAMGLGRMVVEGECCVRFCPQYPHLVPAFTSVDEALKNSQREFLALDLEGEVELTEQGAELRRYALPEAEGDGTLWAMGSTYSHENHSIVDGLSRPGVRLVTFAPVLKHGVFPLAETLHELLEIATAGTRTPVEIEFAVNLSVPKGEPAEFGFLQMRPLAMFDDTEELDIGNVDDAEVVCRSDKVLGNGRIEDIHDIVAIDYAAFERHRSREVALEVARLNAVLQRDATPYLLVGVGRWGSADPYLGIPVTWNQISGARVIVESGFRDFKVTPSQGTHFFQNLTSCNVGYFTVNSQVGEGFIDWSWLEAQPARSRNAFVRHIRLQRPVSIRMSGRTGEGVILKPEA
ncbi:MAG: histidine kinase [Candidatus Latescibacterota bacterium]|nr:MAG: histidine kinase [Candidatus Latescibacterota bacterium]